MALFPQKQPLRFHESSELDIVHCNLLIWIEQRMYMKINDLIHSVSILFSTKIEAASDSPAS